MEMKLKPCPFCGRDVDLAVKTSDLRLHIVCSWCGVSMRDVFEDGAEHLVKAWNTREGEEHE